MSSSAWHLLWLTQNYPPDQGGMAQSCDRIVAGLRQREVRVDIIHLRRGTIAPSVTRQINGCYITAPIGADPAHGLNLLWHRLRQAPPDYTHVVAFGGLLPLLAGPVFAAWLDCPLITLLRGNDLDTAVFNLKRRDLLREAVTQSAYVCCVSHEAQWKLQRLLPRCRTAVIPSGLDSIDWQASHSDQRQAAAFRQQHAAAAHRILGLFGHIKPKKGGLFFLQTLLASGRADHFHLLLAGQLDPAVTAYLLQQTPRLTYTQLPFMDRYALLPRYLACDLVAIPSYYDGLPNVMLEAAALGIPLLAAEVGGMADHLDHGEHGWLFYPGDPHSCRAAIQQASEASDAELSRLGRQAQRLVGESLSHTREIEGYLGILARLRPNQ